jgi:hypothetical protein
VVVTLVEETLSVRWELGTARDLWLMPPQEVALGISVTVSVDLVILPLRAALSASSLGNDMVLWLLSLLRRALVPEPEAVPVLLPMLWVSVASLSEATAETPLLGVRLVRVALTLVLSALSVLIALSELPLLLTRTCSGATECAPPPPKLLLPMVAPPLRPPFLTRRLPKEDVLV